ncbi:membrane protein [Paramyrothecium foliicola]|nr:membrane protein [Paramyrothecium foliicola]
MSLKRISDILSIFFFVFLLNRFLPIRYIVKSVKGPSMASSRVTYLLATLSIISGAFGHTENGMAAHSGGSNGAQESPEIYPTTYFTLDTHQLEIRAHIILMILSWFMLLPVAIMLSLAGSRYTHFVRLALIVTNAIGLLFGVSYKNKTSDQYPGSVHSTVGWIATGFATAQIGHLLIGVVTKLFNRIFRQPQTRAGGYALTPVRERFNFLQEHENPSMLCRQGSFDVEAIQGGAGEREISSDARLYEDELQESGFTSGDETFHGEPDSAQALHNELSTATSKIISKPILIWTRRLALVANVLMDSTILFLAFIAFCTGIATFWGLFKGPAVFNGIAHWIKGAIFFWLGIFNLGRWYGCFAEIGWAWNIRPGNFKRQLWLSLEFVESSLIFLYGSTNIFLEHLAGWGEAWTARDLEHLSITVLFIGGGLCGMLVEYVRVKDLGEKRVAQNMQTMPAWSNATTNERTEHKLNDISMNPLPALVIFLMGKSMASHEQHSMTSTMIHKQWGNLLGAASIARLLTYLIMYIKPPSSPSPSRPPTELLMSFCLISGGILFMASSSDTVEGMIHFGIDAMALYTVTMGFTGILMAWIITLLALKGRGGTTLRPHRTSIKIVISYVLDWAILIAVGIVSYFIGELEPHKRPFSLTDPNISLPYSESEAIPLWLLGILVGVFPFLTILTVSFVFVPGATTPRHTPAAFIWRRKLWEFHAGTMGFVAANIISFFLTQGMKNLFGKPRPDLLDRCQPDLDNAGDHVVGGFTIGSMAGQLYSVSICQQQDSRILDDGFRSYPSGHSSASAAGLVYLSLFFASRFVVVVPFALLSPSAKEISHAAFPSRMVTADPLQDRLRNSGRLSPSASKHIYGYPTQMDAKYQSLRSQAAAPPLYLLAIVLAPFALSIYISASRWFDFRHHGFDILFGYLIGLISAVYCFRYYNLPISGGAGWAWGSRSHDRAFWAGVGRLGYNSQPTEEAFSTAQPDKDHGEGSNHGDCSHEDIPEGQNIQKAIEFLIPTTLNGTDNWPYEEPRERQQMLIDALASGRSPEDAVGDRYAIRPAPQELDAAGAITWDNQDKVAKSVGRIDLISKEIEASLELFDRDHPIAMLREATAKSASTPVGPLIIQGTGAGAEVTTIIIKNGIIKVATQKVQTTGDFTGS